MNVSVFLGSAMGKKRKVGELRRYVAGLAVLLLLLVAGCSTPQGQQIRAVDSTGDTVKFSYDHQMPDGDIQRGVMECEVEGNELKNCRRLPMEYR